MLYQACYINLSSYDEGEYLNLGRDIFLPSSQIIMLLWLHVETGGLRQKKKKLGASWARAQFFKILIFWVKCAFSYRPSHYLLLNKMQVVC